MGEADEQHVSRKFKVLQRMSLQLYDSAGTKTISSADTSLEFQAQQTMF